MPKPFRSCVNLLWGKCLNFRLTHPPISLWITYFMHLPHWGDRGVLAAVDTYAEGKTKKLLLPDACSIPWDLHSVKCSCPVSAQGSLPAASPSTKAGAAHALEELEQVGFHTQSSHHMHTSHYGGQAVTKTDFSAVCCYLLLMLSLEMQKGNSAFPLLKHKPLMSLFWIVSQRPGRDR